MRIKIILGQFGSAFLFLLASCNGDISIIPTQKSVMGEKQPIIIKTPDNQEVTSIPRATQISNIVPTPSSDLSIWINPILPEKLRGQIEFPKVFMEIEQKDDADIKFDVITSEAQTSNVLLLSNWIFSLVTPFPTLKDKVGIDELRFAWYGFEVGTFMGYPIRMTANTKLAFETIWGPASNSWVKVVGRSDLREIARSDNISWALIPFEELEPRWKVLRVEGQSPLDKDFCLSTYPLVIQIGLISGLNELNETNEIKKIIVPYSNRDPQKMTTIVMTGTTALVRNIALRMEEMGVTYPAKDIRDWLQNADLTHISNEVPFYNECPPAKPLREEMRFCSDPKYLELFYFIGADIIELTGNHLLDWGYEPMYDTLSLYQNGKFNYYGGGENYIDARRPLLIEHNGNRFAFIGCNIAGPKSVWATESQPGSAACDFEWIEKEIKLLDDLGYLVIMTLQHFEVNDYKPHSSQRVDFKRMAEAGAVIVSGSQSHFPQTMEFLGDNFIHYGLGNLFFDQMIAENRQEFIDKHVFYDGKYINTELLTAVLEDYSRPRPMTPEEREYFLKTVFQAGNW